MSTRVPLVVEDDGQTEVGSYFVATYPPFSVWTAAAVERDAMPALHSPPAPNVPLGMYLHIPFCRKRCHFCYFRVYTDKNARLDSMGFSPFGQVIEGMEAIDNLYGGYGEGAPRGKGADQQRVQKEGNAYLKANYPNLDYIRSAELVKK